MSGVVLPFWLDRSPDEAVEVALVADRLGFDELWIGELYHFDAFALSAYVAARTANISPVIGPVAAGVRDPVTIARGLASVRQLAHRPVGLALGASNPRVVERFHGREFGGEAERMRVVAEHVRVQVERGRSPSGYRSALDPGPLHLTVAAFGPRMIDVASAVGDRMVVNLVTPAQAAGLAERSQVPTVAWVVAAVEPGPSTRGEFAGQVAHYLAAPGYADMFTQAGFGDLVDRALDRAPLHELVDLVPDELLAAVGLFGSRDDVAASLARYRATGVDVAIVPATAEDPAGERTLSVLAELTR